MSAMPATRTTGMATPTNSSPINSRPTSDGAINNAAPVAASPAAAHTSTLFIANTFGPFKLSHWFAVVEREDGYGAAVGSGLRSKVRLLILPVNLNGES
jgi:hypothetical protein